MSVARVEQIGPATLYLGDCREVLADRDEAAVHAVVTDPPYGLSGEPDMDAVLEVWGRGEDYTGGGAGFMGKKWDAFVPGPATWAEVLRILKPGGHLAAFAGSRTYDLMAVAIRLGGFAIRDQIMWLYGSGFPKNHDIAKCIDKAGGVWRGRAARALPDDARRAFGQNYERTDKGRAISAQAQAWEGWGTALKPAHEPIALARKPFRGTVTANVLAHGTGAINIAACRVGGEVRVNGPASVDAARGAMNASWREDHPATMVEGRWPANVITDGSTDVLIGFPESAREAMRFFYAAKASREEREFGLRDAGVGALRDAGVGALRDAGRSASRVANHHPTVKPIDLMRWLVRLTTVRGGTVCDPFMGAGSTGIAAVREGVSFVGVERDPAYFDIACRRIEAAVEAVAREPDLVRDIDRALSRIRSAQQYGLFDA
jgi:site-specific DNA-methyltransferase (adenine-specific)